jgi:hypothetical protein
MGSKNVICTVTTVILLSHQFLSHWLELKVGCHFPSFYGEKKWFSRSRKPLPSFKLSFAFFKNTKRRILMEFAASSSSEQFFFLGLRWDEETFLSDQLPKKRRKVFFVSSILRGSTWRFVSFFLLLFVRPHNELTEAAEFKLGHRTTWTVQRKFSVCLPFQFKFQFLFYYFLAEAFFHCLKQSEAQRCERISNDSIAKLGSGFFLLFLAGMNLRTGRLEALICPPNRLADQKLNSKSSTVCFCCLKFATQNV